MPVIQPYEQQFLPQGQLNAQATPEQFGANIGKSISDVGDKILEASTQRELTDLYVDMSQARVDITSDLDERLRTTTPGDPTFTDKFRDSIKGTFDKLSEKYTTPGARREFERMSAAITSDFLITSIREQSQLAAQGIKVAQDAIEKNTSAVVFQRPELLPSVMQQTIESIDNPQSIYRNLNVAQKQQMKDEMSIKLRTAAENGKIARDPAGWLASIPQQLLGQFSLLSSTPGGGASKEPTVDPRVVALGPTIKERANRYGVDANIMSAQIQQESKGDTNAIGPETKYGRAKGVAQFMDATAAQYGVDVKDDKSSIDGQARYMKYLLNLFGNDYSKALAAYNWGEGNLQKAIEKYGAMWLANAPKETREYVAKIMNNAGITAMTGQAITPPGEPIKTGNKDFDQLPWETQYQLVNRAQQLLEGQRSEERASIALADRRRNEASNADKMDFLRRITNGETIDPKEIVNNVNFNFEDAAQVIRWQSSKLDKTDPLVFNPVLQAVQSGKITDPNQLWDYVGKGISDTDVQRLQALVNGKGTPLRETQTQFFNMARKFITNTDELLRISDPEGDANFYNFYSLVQQIIADKRKAGATSSDILKLFDPSSTNKDYVGLLLGPYKKPGRKLIVDMANRLTDTNTNVPLNVPPRKPGETIEQYDQRKAAAAGKK